jgi:hypothetical protein
MDKDEEDEEGTKESRQKTMRGIFGLFKAPQSKREKVMSSLVKY